MTNIPIIDISCVNKNNVEHSEFLSQLRFATHEVGFFYLTGHGIDSSLLTKTQRAARQFFSLPEKEKLAVAMINSPHFRGYNRAAAELTRNQPDWREQFDIGAERTAVVMSPDTPAWECLHGPNQWPESMPDLQKIMMEFKEAMTRVALELLHAFALTLELPETSFDTIYGTLPNDHMKLS